MTFRRILVTLNVLNLLEDSADYFQLSHVAGCTVRIIFSTFLIGPVFAIPPRKSLFALYTIDAALIFGYGGIIYQSQWSGETRLYLTFIITTLLV